MTRATPIDWLLLALLGVIWGASFMGVKLALTGLGPAQVAAVRIGLAAVALTALAFALGKGLPPLGHRRLWLHVIGMGLFSNAIPFLLLSWAQKSVTSGYAGITMAVVPLLVLPLAHVFVPGDQMTRKKAAGFALGFAGVAVLIGRDGFASSGAETETLARLACLGASACYAVGSIITRSAPPSNQISFGAGALIAASVVIVPVALLTEPAPAPDLTSIAAAVYLGLFPTALATLILVRIITSAGPSFLTQVNYQVPVWSVLFGSVLLGEPVPPAFVGALGLILAGLAVARAPAWRRRP
ncbi:DMT family transporter [Acidimangrovimonas sediminis]|uniref:DMT family transporter n=1 Tax=Acidimangrovimonas sediminis TaxID=2056283 RepID=UPI000C807B4F|nr:DMT family transporter [Acidimangrovimonas sediminis]